MFERGFVIVAGVGSTSGGGRRLRRDGVSAIVSLDALGERVRPVTMAEDQTLPLLDPFVSLLARGGLPRGCTAAVQGSAAVSLAAGLAAGPVAAGSWAAILGLDEFGLAAAERAGLPLDRVVLVSPPPPRQWAAVAAALIDGFDLVLCGPPRSAERSAPGHFHAGAARVAPGDARRLVARVRERRGVLVQVHWPSGCWPEATDLVFASQRSVWEGIGEGWGHCRARRVEVVASGRRGAGRSRREWMWLPGDDGRIALADAPVDVAGFGGPRRVAEAHGAAARVRSA